MVEKTKFEKVGKLEQAIDTAKHIFAVGGGVYTVIDVVGNVFGNQPSERSHPIGKLAHGGLFRFEDQNAMHDFETGMEDGELVTCVMIFRAWVTDKYGDSAFGELLDTWYKNRFRAMVVRRREPSKKEHVKTTDKAKNVVTEKDVFTEVNNQPAVDFMKQFASIIKDHLPENFDLKKVDLLKLDLTEIEPACLQGCRWLKLKSMPVPPLMDLVPKVKKMTEDFLDPENQIARIERFRQREADMPRWRQWLRS